MTGSPGTPLPQKPGVKAGHRVKAAAVDATWSALRFVHRLEDR
ncbi:hypothetical protein [Nonomuraea typhae]|nr:hypothetical protein [Nonomuraea typhae]